LEESKNRIVVFKINITEYPNEYSEKFIAGGMYKESIKIDPLTCVYRKWESTQYSLDSMPTAHIFE
jgi:hypothetical protein